MGDKKRAEDSRNRTRRVQQILFLLAPLGFTAMVAFQQSSIGMWPPSSVGGWLVLLGPAVLVYGIVLIQWVMVRMGKEIPDLGEGYRPSARAQFENQMHSNASAQAWRDTDDD